MTSGKALIERYVVGAAVPYFFLSLFLLTAILLAQQASRFAELAIYTRIPLPVLTEVALALLPSVLVLTIPIATLAGITIGLARMGTDSEIVALRAAGVGTWRLLGPILLIGVLATGATLYLHLKEAPEAAQGLRRIGLEGALLKLESPVEPRTFNTEIPGYVIYVRDGDKVQGSWERVFISSQQADGSTKIVTARSGRIDSSGEQSELVLSDAVATSIPAESNSEPRSYVIERLAQLRIAIDTGRSALLQRLNKAEPEPEEMNWKELQVQAASSDPREKNEAQRTMHRRVALGVAPLAFALIGGVLGLRIRRGGRGFGILISIGIMVLYYLISLLGESMSRVGTVKPAVGIWAASFLVVFSGLMLLLLNRKSPGRWLLDKLHLKREWFKLRRTISRRGGANVGAGHWGFPSLLDVNLFRTLGITFTVGFVSLAAIFVIFTLFELWRFIATQGASASLVARYLWFLMPLIAVELFPATMLVAVLVTYALLARRSEAIAWWSAGQSVYRLMLPGLLFAFAAAAGIWVIQEHLMPQANLKQDALRTQIRGGEPRGMTGTGRQWLASLPNNRVYFYEYDDHLQALREPIVYQLDAEGVHLQSVTTGLVGVWDNKNQITIRKGESLTLKEMDVERQIVDEVALTGIEQQQVFKPSIDRPSQLSAAALSSYLTAAKHRGVEVSALAVALQKKYAAPFSVLVMAFVGIPLALAFGKRGAVVALCAAVGVSVAYWGVGGGFQQLGNHGLLPPAVAGWSPPVIFAATGTYFLSRIRT